MNKFYILIWYILIILVVVLSELLGRLFAWGGLFVSPLVSLVIALWIQDQFSTAITAAGFGAILKDVISGRSNMGWTSLCWILWMVIVGISRYYSGGSKWLSMVEAILLFFLLYASDLFVSRSFSLDFKYFSSLSFTSILSWIFWNIIFMIVFYAITKFLLTSIKREKR
jgi:cell shape-determining protein MreD